MQRFGMWSQKQIPYKYEMKEFIENLQDEKYMGQLLGIENCKIPRLIHEELDSYLEKIEYFWKI